MVEHLAAHCTRLQRLSLQALPPPCPYHAGPADGSSGGGSSAKPATVVDWAPLARLPCLCAFHLSAPAAEAAAAARALAACRPTPLLKHLKVTADGLSDDQATAIVDAACSLPVLSWLSLSLRLERLPRASAAARGCGGSADGGGGGSSGGGGWTSFGSSGGQAAGRGAEAGAADRAGLVDRLRQRLMAALPSTALELDVMREEAPAPAVFGFPVAINVPQQ
jgi:hypothetical protein